MNGLNSKNMQYKKIQYKEIWNVFINSIYGKNIFYYMYGMDEWWIIENYAIVGIYVHTMDFIDNGMESIIHSADHIHYNG